METTISTEKLKDYAGKLMFYLTDNEYLTLQKEFEVILGWMGKIEQMKDIEKVEPMTFPFPIPNVSFREDKIKDAITVNKALNNCKAFVNDEIKVPKVVE
ncbi:MAG: Asp-tRNA(Asn)/Glu-tRNA(Gln) amidotransferase subunit GatC [Bacilli bacterium]